MEQKNKEWNKKIALPINKFDRRISLLFSFIDILFIASCLCFGYIALEKDSFLILVLFSILLVFCVDNLISLHPNLHNKISATTRVIPVNDDFDLKEFYEQFLHFFTPFGPPKLRSMPFYENKMLYYDLRPLGYEIYLFYDGKELTIKQKKLSNVRILHSTYINEVRVNQFLQELTNTVCYFVNTERLPERQDYMKIFENSIHYLKKYSKNKNSQNPE